jgi:hypothetical protein
LKWLNSSSRTVAFGFVQHLRVPEIFLRVKSGRRLRLTASPPSVSRLSSKSGALDISKSYEHPRLIGIALQSGFCTLSAPSCFLLAICLLHYALDGRGRFLVGDFSLLYSIQTDTVAQPLPIQLLRVPFSSEVMRPGCEACNFKQSRNRL